MISKIYTFNIGGGTAPYTYLFSTTDTCITFNNTTGTLDADGDIQATITATDEACFLSAVVSLTVSDSSSPQCSVTEPVALTNPCAGLTLSAITQNNFSFSTLASGGSPGYTYSWLYDQTLFSNSGSTDSNIINLNWLGVVNPAPTTSQITVTVTDTNGCSTSESLVAQLEVPVAQHLEVILPCYLNKNPCGGTHYGQVAFPVTGSNIDWTSLNITGSGDITVTNNNDGTAFVCYTGTDTGISLVLQWSISNNLGIESDLGNIYMSIPPCTIAGTCYLTGNAESIQLTSTDIVGTVKTLNIVDRVITSDLITWSTFTILNAPAFGTATLNSSQEIEYTITDITTTTNVPDIVKWRVINACGASLTITDIINRDVIAAPVAVGDVICMTCNTPSASTDITANDTGDIDKSTIIIESVAADVLYTKDSNNDFIFTAIPNASLSRIVQYNVSNTQGVASNTANVILSVACAGVPSDLDVTCLVTKTFDLLDRFVGAAAIGYTFAETTAGAITYVGQGGVIGAVTGGVDFTGITPGQYTFQMTALGSGACAATTDVETVTITVQEDPALTIVSGVNNGNNTGTVTYTTDGVLGISSMTITNNGVTPSYITSPSFDANGDGSFIASLAVGVTAIFQIVAYTTCGTTITQTVNIVN